jgi:hypothetical protein
LGAVGVLSSAQAFATLALARRRSLRAACAVLDGEGDRTVVFEASAWRETSLQAAGAVFSR